MMLGEARRLVEGVLYGASRWRHWLGITLNIALLNSPAAAAAIMRTLADHLRHWQAARGVPPLYAWVRECGGRHGDHAHMLIAIPPGCGPALARAIRRWLRGPSIRGDLARGTLHSRGTTAGGWLGYCLKTLSVRDARRLTAQTGFRVFPEPPAAPVVGQRLGIARALGAKARTATQPQRGRNTPWPEQRQCVTVQHSRNTR